MNKILIALGIGAIVLGGVLFSPQKHENLTPIESILDMSCQDFMAAQLDQMPTSDDLDNLPREEIIRKIQNTPMARVFRHHVMLSGSDTPMGDVQSNQLFQVCSKDKKLSVREAWSIAIKRQ